MVSVPPCPSADVVLMLSDSAPQAHAVSSRASNANGRGDVKRSMHWVVARLASALSTGAVTVRSRAARHDAPPAACLVRSAILSIGLALAPIARPIDTQPTQVQPAESLA